MRRIASELVEATVKPVLTRFDLRVERRLFLPGFLRRLLPSRLGWSIIVDGRKVGETEAARVGKGRT